MCVKTKELGPIGGVRRARPLDPPMLIKKFINITLFLQILGDPSLNDVPQKHT